MWRAPNFWLFCLLSLNHIQMSYASGHGGTIHNRLRNSSKLDRLILEVNMWYELASINDTHAGLVGCKTCTLLSLVLALRSSWHPVKIYSCPVVDDLVVDGWNDNHKKISALRPGANHTASSIRMFPDSAAGRESRHALARWTNENPEYDKKIPSAKKRPWILYKDSISHFKQYVVLLAGIVIFLFLKRLVIFSFPSLCSTVSNLSHVWTRTQHAGGLRVAHRSGPRTSARASEITVNAVSPTKPCTAALSVAVHYK